MTACTEVTNGSLTMDAKSIDSKDRYRSWHSAGTSFRIIKKLIKNHESPQHNKMNYQKAVEYVPENSRTASLQKSTLPHQYTGRIKLQP